MLIAMMGDTHDSVMEFMKEERYSSKCYFMYENGFFKRSSWGKGREKYIIIAEVNNKLRDSDEWEGGINNLK